VLLPQPGVSNGAVPPPLLGHKDDTTDALCLCADPLLATSSMGDFSVGDFTSSGTPNRGEHPKAPPPVAALPSAELDACGGHWGFTPESPKKEVYHYHVQDRAPFTFGCYGPNDDGSLVSVEQCREFYPTCDGNVQTLQTSDGPVDYDDWCPCYDAHGSNTGKKIAELPAVAKGAKHPKVAKKGASNSFMAKYPAAAPEEQRHHSPTFRLAWAPLLLAAASLAALALFVALRFPRRPAHAARDCAAESSDTSASPRE